MAIRNLLHANHLEDFSEWLASNEWKLEKTKGDYEVLRARKGKTLLLVYEKIGAKHLTIEGRFVGLVKAFLRSRTEKGKEKT